MTKKDDDDKKLKYTGMIKTGGFIGGQGPKNAKDRPPPPKVGGGISDKLVSKETEK